MATGTRDTERMQELLRQRLEALEQDATRDGGHIDAGRLADARRLARVIEMHRTHGPPPPPRRWFPALAFTVTLSVVSLLAFARCRTTEVELRATVSGLRFTALRAQQLSDPVRARSVDLAGTMVIDGPFTAVWQPRDSSQLHIHFDSAATRAPGGITLDAIRVSAGVATRIRQGADARHWTLDFAGAPGDSIRVQSDLLGAMRLESPDTSAALVRFETPDQLTAAGAPGAFRVGLTLPEGGTWSLHPMAVRELSVVEQRDQADAAVPATERLSTLLGGSLFFEALGGRERAIRPGELLEMDDAAGVIRAMRATPAGVELVFHGRVRGLRAGSGASQASLMPTWLEWLRAQQALALLWGSAFYLFGLAMATRKWWRSGEA